MDDSFEIERNSSTSSQSGSSKTLSLGDVSGEEATTAKGSDHIVRPSVSVPNKRPRKGHSKSRRGCLNCKKARLKCKENHPTCEYCQQRHLTCEWPDLQIREVNVGQYGMLVRKTSPKAPVESLSPVLQSKGPVFTMEDFRLFNHFIQHAYPHQPLGNETVWRHEIPCIASEYSYLLESMLALSAADLASSSPNQSELVCSSYRHRVKAISSLRAAINDGINDFRDGNAMLATFFSLIFQSVRMSDGLVEYMSFIRGITAVGTYMGEQHMKFLFRHLFGDENVEPLKDGLQAAPLIDPHLVNGACRSLEFLQPLCVSGSEKKMFALLLTAARSLVTSSMEAYMTIREIYALFAHYMTHTEFQTFTDPHNQIGRLLQSHFVALQLIMTPITRVENVEDRGERRPMAKSGVTVCWFEALHRDLPLDLRPYYEWPLWVEREVRRGGGVVVNGLYGDS